MILSSCLARLNMRPSTVVSRLICAFEGLRRTSGTTVTVPSRFRTVRSRLTSRSSARRCLMYALIVAVVTCESFILPKYATRCLIRPSASVNDFLVDLVIGFHELRSVGDTQILNDDPFTSSDGAF